MDIVFLELKSIGSGRAIDDQTIELRYLVPGQIQYQSRNLPLAEITGLYDFADRDFTKTNPDLAQIGL
jgi:hypothetical protein